MTTKELVAGLNTHDFFAKVGANGKVFFAMKDDAGQTIFVNRTVKIAGADSEGNAIPATDDSGQTVWQYTVGKPLQATEQA